MSLISSVAPAVTVSGVTPVGARYHHDWRERGLSDHAPLEADLD